MFILSSNLLIPFYKSSQSLFFSVFNGFEFFVMLKQLKNIIKAFYVRTLMIISLFKSINCNPFLFFCIISNICGNFNPSQNFYFSICFNIFTVINTDFLSPLCLFCITPSPHFPCFLFFFCKLVFFPVILCLLILCLFHREYSLSNVNMQYQDFRSLLYMCI